MVSVLRTVTEHGELRPGYVDSTLDTLMQTEWVVYSKACVSHTESVVAYLARIREALEQDSKSTEPHVANDNANAIEEYPCPKCHVMMRVITLLPPVRWIGH